MKMNKTSWFLVLIWLAGETIMGFYRWNIPNGLDKTYWLCAVGLTALIFISIWGMGSLGRGR